MTQEKNVPKITSRYGFSRIKDVVSLYFFDLIKNKKKDASRLIPLLSEDIQKKSNLSDQLTQKDISILKDIIAQDQDSFIKYFSELVEVIGYLIDSSMVHRKIKAHLIVKNLAEFMYKKGINLLQNFGMFYQSVREVIVILKKNYPNFFPILYRSEKGLTYKNRQEKRSRYIKIVGSRIKLHIIENIYNGLYFRDGRGRCPECAKEGFKTNTDISRLKAIEFHHSKEKKYIYSASKLYLMFNDNQANPLFLENLVKLMELKQIELLCGNHHDLLNYKYFNFFNHIIAWKDIPKSFPQDIFSLSPELIHVLIRISVDHFSKTKNKSISSKDNIRVEIVRLLKKRYVIEITYGESCHICGEFNTKEHIYSFQFCHIKEDKKTVDFSKLSKYYSCSKIAKILEQEEGGFVCSNCHTVFHFKKYIPLLDKIYDDKNMIKKVLNDYKYVHDRFALFYKTKDIRDPLKQSMRISDSFETYLIAISEILSSGQVVTNSSLANYLDYANSNAPIKFFNRNKEIMRNYVYINKIGKETKYSLTNKGKEAISLMNYFKKYYSSI
ncbi:MAG: hypothetical protein EU535_08490 [Promethearchaeota archaeon]|nr:MAG: hypothetical protein EU535_08490 [Candidatus Lokiarchaeota archaeon]